jgi:hypothetical protein
LHHALEEMHAAWHGGRPLAAEELLDTHPALREETGAAIRVIQEEILLRSEAGQEVATVELLQRFPQWEHHLRRLLEIQRQVWDGHWELGPGELVPQFPEVGEVLGDCKLVAELGRGAQGRVFLAQQLPLADRPLVLKLSACEGQEHVSLARLQHTHIVPLYWAIDHVARNLRVLCMPYLGGATLAAALARLAERPPARRTGRDLLEALDRMEPRTPVALPHEGPARRALAQESYPRALCRVAAGLAEALHYAHERGLLHLDVKPSNVLLAADGQPLLLDFHLARGPLRVGDPAPERLGGTPAYMPPEQALAIEAVQRRLALALAVDVRTDIYSLGLVLYEALGGRLPKATDPMPLCRLNRQVSVGLSDIVGRCLARDADRRYATAAALAGDLRRHLDDLPLRGVANRSWVERWRKWRRRAPHALPLAALLLALLGAVTTASGLSWRQMQRQRDEVKSALARGEQEFAAKRYEAAETVLRQGHEQAESSFLARDLAALFGPHLRRAGRARVAQELHDYMDKVRILSITGAAPTLHEQRAHLALMRTHWQERQPLLDRAGAPLEQDIEEDIRADLIDLAVFGTDLRLRWVRDGDKATVRREALGQLEEADRLLGPSRLLRREQQAHAEALGLTEVASETARKATEAPEERSGRLAAGLALLRRGKLKEAAAELRRLKQTGPREFWGSFALGYCALRLQEPRSAIEEFNFCEGKRAGVAECFLYRAEARAALGELDEARRDCEQALALRQDWAEARQLQDRLAKWSP